MSGVELCRVKNRVTNSKSFGVIEKLSISVDRPTPEQIEAVQNSQLFEGDIVGIPADAQVSVRQHDMPIAFDEDESEQAKRIFSKPVSHSSFSFSQRNVQFHSALNLVTYPDKLWADGIVPYMLEEGMTSE